MSNSAGDQQEIPLPKLRELASKYSQNAQQCQEIATFLRSQNGSLFWQSEAATVFKQHMQDYMSKLEQFQRDFTSLSTSLTQRADILEASGNR